LINKLKFQNLSEPFQELDDDYASVALLIYEEKELIFIKRSEDMPTHKGHIAFPGGKKEAFDQNIIDTAVREASEELLIDSKSITPIGILDPIDTVEYKFPVYPILCRINEKPFSFNKSEVQEIYFVFIEDLKNNKNWTYRGSYDSDWIFKIDNEILWGATAKMVRSLLSFS
jgi:8-oxo-dGTP pyrophosphatase MutT (NUDIX family)